jgi:hypothetical protein
MTTSVLWTATGLCCFQRSGADNKVLPLDDPSLAGGQPTNTLLSRILAQKAMLSNNNLHNDEHVTRGDDDESLDDLAIRERKRLDKMLHPAEATDDDSEEYKYTPVPNIKPITLPKPAESATPRYGERVTRSTNGPSYRKPFIHKINGPQFPTQEPRQHRTTDLSSLIKTYKPPLVAKTKILEQEASAKERERLKAANAAAVANGYTLYSNDTTNEDDWDTKARW